MLNTLEEKGLIQRYKSDIDARKTFVRLTDLGRTKAMEIQNYWENLMTRLLKDVSDDDLEAFFRVLAKMADKMEGEYTNV